MVIEKTCSRCREAKPLENFYSSKKTKDGRDHYCAQCRKAQVQRHHAIPANRDRKREYEKQPERLERKSFLARERYRANPPPPRPPVLFVCEMCSETFVRSGHNQKRCADCNHAWAVGKKYKKWGLTPALYWSWVEAGVCHMCGEPSAGRMSVDHCETTGRLGYSHQRCNLGIAQAKHDPKILLRWISYLEAA